MRLRPGPYPASTGCCSAPAALPGWEPQTLRRDRPGAGRSAPVPEDDEIEVTAARALNPRVLLLGSALGHARSGRCCPQLSRKAMTARPLMGPPKQHPNQQAVRRTADPAPNPSAIRL